MSAHYTLWPITYQLHFPWCVACRFRDVTAHASFIQLSAAKMNGWGLFKTILCLIYFLVSNVIHVLHVCLMFITVCCFESIACSDTAHPSGWSCTHNWWDINAHLTQWWFYPSHSLCVYIIMPVFGSLWSWNHSIYFCNRLSWNAWVRGCLSVPFTAGAHLTSIWMSHTANITHDEK